MAEKSTRFSSETIWQVLVGIAVACLTMITAAVVRREFFVAYQVAGAAAEDGSGTRSAPRTPEPPVPIDNWRQVSGKGHRIGPERAKLTIVVFSDFECPFCAKFATQVFPELQKAFPNDVAMLFRQWPLSNHKFAYSAARATECAAMQGRFQQLHDALFADQKSIGAKSFSAYAKEAGIPSIGKFELCMRPTSPLESIEKDIAEARRIGGKGTPTIIMIGMRLRPPYSPQAITEHARKALEKTAQQ